ncbi:hypothetical protein [Bradyrhizobium sp.]|uniref:hypothetical protein n=1 Tax=Bradyrhizobium sp. TaxID=376 RepID=UPI0039E5E034
MAIVAGNRAVRCAADAKAKQNQTGMSGKHSHRVVARKRKRSCENPPNCAAKRSFLPKDAACLGKS